MYWFLVLILFIASTNSSLIKTSYLRVTPLEAEDVNIFPKDRNSSRNRIIGGNEANDNDFHYQVGLYIREGNSRFFCGGSLIAQDTVLTAAHCVKNADEVYVFFAHHYTPDFRQILNDTEENVLKSTVFKVHEDYDKNYFANDIALVYLPENITLTEKIAVVLLDKGTNKHVGQLATVSGWGLTFQGDSIQGGRGLRYAQDVIISNEECANDYLISHTTILDSHICMSNKNSKSTCFGDSGGPLVVDGVQVGIVSFGPAICSIRPSGFTRVSSFAHWIAEHAPGATLKSSSGIAIIYNPTLYSISLVLIIGLIKN